MSTFIIIVVCLAVLYGLVRLVKFLNKPTQMDCCKTGKCDVIFKAKPVVSVTPAPVVPNGTPVVAPVKKVAKKTTKKVVVAKVKKTK